MSLTNRKQNDHFGGNKMVFGLLFLLKIYEKERHNHFPD